MPVHEVMMYQDNSGKLHGTKGEARKANLSMKMQKLLLKELGLEEFDKAGFRNIHSPLGLHKVSELLCNKDFIYDVQQLLNVEILNEQ